MARLPSAGRTIAIIVALILAGVAVYFIWRYVNDIEAEVRQGQELVEVYVATDTIPAGARAEAAISGGLIETTELPRANRPAGSITSLDQISGLAASAEILPGEIILQQRFADPASSAVEFEIPEGLQAMSIEVEVPPGVAGFVQPGDRISIIAHIEVPDEAAPVIGPDGSLVQPEGAADGPTETRSQFVVQGVEVLSVGRRVIVTTPEGQEQDQVQQTESVLTTVAVSDLQAEKVVFALNEGELYFTLLPEGYEPGDTPGRTFDDLFAATP